MKSPAIASASGFDRLSPGAQLSAVAQFDKLDPRQQRFALEYLKDLNATEAAKRAGYSKKTANQQGPRLLVKVGSILAPLLRAQQEELAEDSGVTRKEWLREIQRIAFHDPRKMFDNHGNAKDIPSLDQDPAAALAGFEIVEEFDGRGESRICVGYTKKYKLADKLRALELFGKATGYLVEKHEHTGTNGDPIQHSLEVVYK